jgi:hypothetical protein
MIARLNKGQRYGQEALDSPWRANQKSMEWPLPQIACQCPLLPDLIDDRLKMGNDGHKIRHIQLKREIYECLFGNS